MAKNSLKGEILAGTDFVQCSNPDGGHLTEVDGDGTVVSEIYVPPGRHRARDFMSKIGPGHYLVPSDDVYAYAPLQRSQAHTFGEQAYETAASQTFRVDRADREKRRNDRLERALSAQERRQNLLERALARARGEAQDDAQTEKPDDEKSVPAQDSPSKVADEAQP